MSTALFCLAGLVYIAGSVVNGKRAISTVVYERVTTSVSVSSLALRFE